MSATTTVPARSLRLVQSGGKKTPVEAWIVEDKLVFREHLKPNKTFTLTPFHFVIHDQQKCVFEIHTVLPHKTHTIKFKPNNPFDVETWVKYVQSSLQRICKRGFDDSFLHPTEHTSQMHVGPCWCSQYPNSISIMVLYIEEPLGERKENLFVRNQPVEALTEVSSHPQQHNWKWEIPAGSEVEDFSNYGVYSLVVGGIYFAFNNHKNAVLWKEGFEHSLRDKKERGSSPSPQSPGRRKKEKQRKEEKAPKVKLFNTSKVNGLISAMISSDNDGGGTGSESSSSFSTISTTSTTSTRSMTMRAKKSPIYRSEDMFTDDDSEFAIATSSTPLGVPSQTESDRIKNLVRPESETFKQSTLEASIFPESTHAVRQVINQGPQESLDDIIFTPGAESIDGRKQTKQKQKIKKKIEGSVSSSFWSPSTAAASFSSSSNHNLPHTPSRTAHAHAEGTQSPISDYSATDTHESFSIDVKGYGPVNCEVKRVNSESNIIYSPLGLPADSVQRSTDDFPQYPSYDENSNENDDADITSDESENHLNDDDNCEESSDEESSDGDDGSEDGSRGSSIPSHEMTNVEYITKIASLTERLRFKEERINEMQKELDDLRKVLLTCASSGGLSTTNVFKELYEQLKENNEQALKDTAQVVAENKEKDEKIKTLQKSLRVVKKKNSNSLVKSDVVLLNLKNDLTALRNDKKQMMNTIAMLNVANERLNWKDKVNQKNIAKLKKPCEKIDKVVIFMNETLVYYIRYDRDNRAIETSRHRQEAMTIIKNIPK